MAAVKQKVEVVQRGGDDEDVSAKIIAQSIRDISIAAKALLGAGLKRRGLLVLLNDMTGVPKKDISLILDAQRDLAAHYTER